MVAVGGAFAASRFGAALRPEPHTAPAAPTIVSIEQDGLRYQFNTISGRQFLYDLSQPEAARVDLAPLRPADTLRLRKLLERRLSIPDLDRLHDPHRESAEALRGMGYL